MRIQSRLGKSKSVLHQLVHHRFPASCPSGSCFDQSRSHIVLYQIIPLVCELAGKDGRDFLPYVGFFFRIRCLLIGYAIRTVTVLQCLC